MISLVGQDFTFSCQQLCDEIFSWMIDVWMKDHLVSDNNCNNVITSVIVQEMTNNVELTLSFGDITIYNWY